jgi:hypothetical protein
MEKYAVKSLQHITYRITGVSMQLIKNQQHGKYGTEVDLTIRKEKK